MTKSQLLTEQALEVLAKIDFAGRYYDYYKSRAEIEKKGNSTLNQEDFETVLSQSGMKFKYVKKDKFFSCKEISRSLSFELKIAFPYSTVELILSIKDGTEYFGGPFARIARQVAQVADPSFSPYPASPKLPFSNVEELQEAIQFGISLFKEVKITLLSEIPFQTI